MKLTALVEEHRAAGATLVEFAGWLMPLRYTSDLAEHRAVREKAGVFDLSHMAEFRVTGPQASAFVDSAVVTRVSGIAVGRAKYTMICDDTGAIRDDLIVYRLGADEYLVVANAANATVVGEMLARESATWQVQVVDETDKTALIAVQGPAAAGIVTEILGPAAIDLKRYAAVSLRDLDPWGDVLVARTGYTGEDGFELFVSPAVAPALWRTVLSVGAAAGAVPAGLAARDSLRLEAGMPLYGHELDPTVTPYEAGLGRVVTLHANPADGPDAPPRDFVGAQALARAAATPPQRQLVGLRGQGRRAARAGYPVVASSEPGAATVGAVTSGLPSPTLGVPIAMAYVDASVSQPGGTLSVDVRGTVEPFDVVPLPFYRRQEG